LGRGLKVKYKGANDAGALKDTAVSLWQYRDSQWAKKASVCAGRQLPQGRKLVFVRSQFVMD
jgi:hypothetical protein